MKHKKLKKITLCTINNGYELTIEKNSYFYFDIPTLIEGVMVHVGLHHTEVCHKMILSTLCNAPSKTPHATICLIR